MANPKKHKVVRQTERAGGEEKKLSHSVFHRPPVNGQFPQRFEIEDIHPPATLTLTLNFTSHQNFWKLCVFLFFGSNG